MSPPTGGLVKPPPRHCTGCGARIWSLTTVRIPEGKNAARWRDLCNQCADPDDRDPWELFTTGRHAGCAANRRSSP